MSVQYNIRYIMVVVLISACSSFSVFAQGPGVFPPGFAANNKKATVVKKITGPGSRSGAVRSRSPGPTAPSASKAKNLPQPSSKVINGSSQNELQLNFKTTPLEIVLLDYSEKTGKTLLRAPGLPSPMFTLRSQGKLSITEYLTAIETVLSMHGVGLVSTGEKFIRVVPIADVITEPGEIKEKMIDGLLSEDSGELISQMIVLKHIDIAEATKAIQPLLHKYGKITPFERTNSILVTDSVGNINRALQILRMIDQPIDAREAPRVIQIHYAKASEIKQKLMEIIAESQKDKAKSTVAATRPNGAPGFVSRGPTGVIRPRSTRTPATATQIKSLIEEAERGIIRGSVKIVADERTNKLIIITRPENMSFFEKIVAVLDIETSPDVEVKVVRLEFAQAKEIAGMLNDLIGANDKDDVPTAPPGGADSPDRSQALDAYVKSLKKADAVANKKSSVGELSKDNIKILSDERTNALILMASKGDLVALLDIIKDMDMMLSQVLIEAVIIDVKLGGTLDTGVTWIQESLTAYGKDSNGSRSPIASFSGRAGGSFTTERGDALATSGLAKSGLGYFLTLYDLNLHAVIKAVSSDTRSKVISTPVLLTTDNTEAKLSSTEKVYVFNGRSYYNSYAGSGNNNNSSANYKQQDIGMELTVTPHINENKIVMMEIKQKISEPGDQAGDTDELAGKTISRDREIEASIAVKSGQTIVLGGQVREGSKRTRTKVPLLGDIPLLGRLFNSDSRTKARTETIVFITPYVMDTPEEADGETRRRKDSLNIKGMWKKGWSGSDLAEDPKNHWWSKSDKLSTSRRDFTWETSSGKAARGGHEEVETAEVTEVAETRRPRPYSEVESDVDEFLRKQREKWDKALDEVQ